MSERIMKENRIEEIKKLAAGLRAKAEFTGARAADPEALVTHMAHASGKCGALGCNLIEATE
ncbi:MAG: hypothetical protein AB1641_12205 [Thermodesulfobacteriota bacterium]